MAFALFLNYVLSSKCSILRSVYSTKLKRYQSFWNSEWQNQFTGKSCSTRSPSLQLDSFETFTHICSPDECSEIWTNSCLQNFLLICQNQNNPKPTSQPHTRKNPNRPNLFPWGREEDNSSGVLLSWNYRKEV